MLLTQSRKQFATPKYHKLRENNTNYILYAKIKEKYRSMNIIFATS